MTRRFITAGRLKKNLRYGENPHQFACYYQTNQKNDTLSTTLKGIEKIINEEDERILKLEVDVMRQDGTSTTPGFALVKLLK